MRNLEDRKHVIRMLILYTCIGMAVMSVTAFFQYRAYTANYNQAVGRICAQVLAQYPKTSASSLAAILNDTADRTSVAEGEDFLRTYGIDMKRDAAVRSNDRKLQQFLVVDAVLMLVVSLGFALIVFAQHRYYRTQIRQTAQYLQRINRGDYQLKMDDSQEGEVSILKSELYKTAIVMREAAMNAREDKMRLKDSLSDISHQLKTPLTSLSINIENLESHLDMEPQAKRRTLRRARCDIGNITQMVQAILKLSRLDADVVEFTRKETGIEEIVDKAVDSVTALCDLKNIELTVRPDSDRSAVLYCDGYWQTEALTNIVKNAVEHAVNRVVIGYYRYEMYDEVIVENDGEPISEQDRRQIFTRFYRGEDASPDSIGIGLSLAEAIVRHDNGYILVDAAGRQQDREEGTRFTLRYFHDRSSIAVCDSL